MFTHILFDLDGTLTDSAPGITRSVQFALEHFGIRVQDPSQLNAYVGPPLKDSFMEYHGFSDAQADLAVEKYRERFAATGIWENSLYEGIPQLLDTLVSRGKKLILATSKPEYFAIKILRHFDIFSYFSLVRGSDMDGVLAEKGEIIASALRDADIADLHNAVMVGDRKYDIHGAKANGLPSVGVLYGYGTREELNNAGADFIVENLHELNAILLYNTNKL